MNDDQIEELSKRHENDKTKVNNTFSNKIPEKSKVPVDAKKIKYDNRLPKDIYNDTNEISDQKESIIDMYNKQQNEDQHGNVISSSSSSKKPIFKTNDDDAKFEELVERHKNEKQKVNQFEITEVAPYTVEQIENEVNKSRNSETNNQTNEK